VRVTSISAVIDKNLRSLRMGAKQCSGNRLTLLAIDDQIERLGSSLKG